MQAISFLGSDLRTTQVRDYLKKLEDKINRSYDQKDMQEYKRNFTKFLWIRKCLHACTEFTINQFSELISKERKSLEADYLVVEDPVTHEQTESVDLEIVKKAFGFDTEFAENINNEPLFEFRINESDFGIRSIFFVTAQKFNDIHSNYECFVSIFEKEKYSSDFKRRNGNSITNNFVRESYNVYALYRKACKNFSHEFDEFFLDEKYLL